MRIKNAYVEGYLGLLEGTGRNELSVDFAPAHEAGLQRIMLFGRNGSGKSTFMNALTPFPSQGDDRSSIIVPGRAGRKVITFMRGETEVKCDIRWSSKGKTSCFMFLNGSDQPMELTAKGNIGEYLKAVEQELGVTPEFLKIGRVGSRVSGFLDLGPGPRKNYIGNFMPEVEEWAAMHKNVSKRVSAMKQQLQGLQVELDRIEPREELDNALRRGEAELARLRDEGSRLDTRIGSAQGALDEMRPTRLRIIEEAGLPPSDDYIFNPIAAAASAQEGVATRAEGQIAKLVQERPRLEAFRDPVVAKAKAAEIGNTVAGLNGQLDALRSTRLDARGRLDTAIKAETEAKTALNKAAGSAAQLETLTTQAAQLEAKVHMLTETAEGMAAVPDELSYDEVKVASDALMGLESEVADLRGAFPTPELLDLAVKNAMDSDALRGVAAGLTANARELRTRLDTARSRIGTIEAQVQFHNRFAGMHCNDPRCPFESHIGQFATAGEELASKKAEIESLEGRSENATAEARNAEVAASAAKAVVAAHSRLRRYRPVLEAAGVWESVGPSAAFYDLVASGTAVTSQVLSVTNLLEAVGVKRDLSESKRTLAGVRERIAGLEALRDAREQLEESAGRASEAVSRAREEHDAANSKVTQVEQSVGVQEQALALINQLITLHDNAEAARAKAATLAEAGTVLEQMRERWTAAETDLNEARGARDSVTIGMQSADQALAGARLRLSRRDEFEGRLAEMQGKLERAQAVAEACHPARGAPIEFLRDFLDVTRDTVNELLDVAMRGEFRIGFSLTDSEFRVPVSKGSGRVIPDVTEASEGQLALAKTVLSLALVKQTVQAQGGYNVICFDEIDGMLDRERNRERFAEIVERLSSELGLEQLVMISHNDNFAASPAGIVLFPGHAMPVTDESFLSNKLILADFS
jgi:DNA repair exonuclease SbcCD ATPase subunit